MAEKSRTYNSARNLGYSVAWNIIIYLFSFITRTIFISKLGADYLGVNGLFSNILSILSLAELGIGGSFIFSLYKPLAENNTEQVSALIHLFKLLYRIVAAAVGVIGLALVPFLGVLIKDKPDIPNLTGIYLIFLGLQVVSYLSKSKRSLITADQKDYVNTTNTNLFILLQYLLQIIVLFTVKSFVVYLLVQAVCVVSSNILINSKANKMYPYLKEKPVPKLPKAERANLIIKIRAQILHHMGYVVLNGTDNLVISAFVGVVWVGFYSNYILIIGIIIKIISMVFSAVVASTGNFVVKEESEKTYRLFQKMNFVNFFLCAICTVCLWALFNPFIIIWIGKQYLLSDTVVALIVINFYIGRNGMRQSMLAFKNPSCLFTKDKYMSVVGAVINLVLSIVLVQKMGIAGVFIGTLASELLTATFVEPYILFKYLFKRSVWIYVAKYSTYAAITALLAVAMKYLVGIIFVKTWLSWMLSALVCAVITIAVLCVIFCKTEEFRMVGGFIKGLLQKVRRKKPAEQ